MKNQEKFIKALSAVIEATAMPELRLETVAWDSLAVITIIAAADDYMGVIPDGLALSQCETVAEVYTLCGVAL